MDIYKEITQNEVEAIDSEINHLEKMIKNLEAKQITNNLIKDPTKTVKLKLNYALKESRFDYEKIKKIESEKRENKIKARVGIDANWLAANMQEPDIKQFYLKTEMVKPIGDFRSLENQVEEKREINKTGWDSYLEGIEKGENNFDF